jgi:type II secretory pathway component PulL
MINLLPPEAKEAITYGRKNRSLVAWIGAFVIVLFGVLILTLAGAFYVNAEANTYTKKAEEAKQRIASQNLESAQKNAESFSSNLDTVVKLLKDQLLFSKIIRSMGAVLPDGVILKEINYDTKESTMSLDVIGPSEQSVTQAFINISSDTNKLFSKADLVQVQRGEGGQFTANIVVLINKDSEFFFLNDVTKKAVNQ